MNTLLPDELTFVQPHDSAVCNGNPAWKMVFDENSGMVEVRRGQMFQLAWIVFGLILGSFMFWGLTWASENLVQADDVKKGLRLAAVFFFFLMFLSLSCLPALTVWLNSRYWKGPLRFRADLNTGELFFTRENTLYQRNDYTKLIIGYAIGYDARKAELVGNVVVERRIGADQSHHPVGPLRIVQVYLLLLTPQGKWVRHNLTWDATVGRKRRYLKPFQDLSEALRPLTKGEEISRTFTIVECSENQKKESKREA